MTRIALFSDIHANCEALCRALDDLDGRADVIWCLGDVLGYGPWPEETWDKLYNAGLPPVTIAGNHDWGVAGHKRMEIWQIEAAGGGMVELAYANQGATKVWRRQRNALQNAGRKDVLDRLLTLPIVASPEPGIYLAHGCLHAGGDPLRVNTFDYPDFPSYAETSFQAAWKLARGTTGELPEMWERPQHGWQPPRLICVGHNHYRTLWRRDANDPDAAPDKLATLKWGKAKIIKGKTNFVKDHWNERRSVPDGKYDLGNWDDHPIFLNPGSVGFPRDGVGPASYAILDTTERTVAFRTVQYNVDLARKRVKELGYPAFLLDIDFLGQWK